MKKSITIITLILLTTITYAQVGIGTEDPKTTLDVEGQPADNTKADGILIPRLSLGQLETKIGAYGADQYGALVFINDVTGGSTISETVDIQEPGFYYWDAPNSNWEAVATSAAPPAVGTISAGGDTWMDRNLGASQVAQSSTDAAAYGDLYQWGRAADGHEDRNSPTYDGDANGFPSTATAQGAWDGKFITTLSSPYDWLGTNHDNNLWQGVNGVNNPCPAGYRVPTDTELSNLNISNSADAFSILKLPVAGYRRSGNGSLDAVGSIGGCWSSSGSSTNARHLFFNSSKSNIYFSAGGRGRGRSVRCIKD